MSKIYHNEDFLKLNTVKQKIISSLLAYNYELIAMCYARIYTASSQSTNWLYTELEGGLTIVIDYARKSARFLLFDLNTLEINFECELYKKFNLFYTSLTKTLHCFEVNQGFIGFLIPDVNSSQDFFKSVYKLTDTVIANIIKKRIIPDKNEIKLNSSKVLALLKEKLSSEYFFKDNVLTEKKLELDLNDIEKTMNMIEYDTENEKFLITGNVKEIDEIVGRVKSVKYSDKNGLKIKDTVAYAMEIYQSMMNSMVKNKEISASKEKELAEEKKKNSLFQSIKKQVDGGSDNNNKVHQQQQITKKPEAPKGVPAVPKGVPPVPKGVPAVPKGVPPVPKGVPPVPKGIPAIPKTVPSVPATQSAQNSIPNQNASNTNSIDNNNMDDIQNNNHTNEIGDNSTNTTSVPVEKKKPYVRKEPKMDMMTELKMKLANRGNVNANPLNNTINKPPVIMNTSTITVTTTNTETNDSNTNSIILLENSINSETGKLINTSSNNTITKSDPNVTQRKSNIDSMREALNRKFGGAPSNPTPVTKENNKPLESMNSDNSKPVITTAPSSNAPKLNMNKMIEQMEKSYMSGATDSKEEPKPFTNNKIIPVENKTIAIKAPVAPIKGNAPKIPGVPLPPPLTIPLPPKINAPVKSAAPKNKAPELTLMEQVSKGVQLKKCDTVEKTGLDVLQKREGITKNTESDTPNVEVKNDLFAEMKKVQLRKVNK